MDVVGVLPMGNEVRNIYGAWSDGQLGVDDLSAPIGGALNGLGLFLDPLNWLVGIGVGWLVDWLLSNVKPLKQAMDYVTGNIEAIHSWAEQFQEASKSVAEDAVAAIEAANAVLAVWQGQAANAFKSAVSSSVEFKRSISEREHTIYTLTYALAGLVAIVKEIVVGLVKELLTDLISKGLLAAAAAIPSLGSSIGAYMAWAAGKYALVMGKIATWFQKLFSRAAEMTSKFGALSRMFERAAAGFGKLAASFAGMEKAAAKAADDAARSTQHQDRMNQRKQNADDLYNQAEGMSGRPARTTRRQGDTQIRRAEDQRVKMKNANRAGQDALDDAGAGASAGTKAVVNDGGSAAQDEFDNFDSYNPADSIPVFG